MRPEIVTDEMLDFLDNLRKSGVTNMWGAALYLEEEFPLSHEDAKTVLVYWMQTFGQKSR